MSLVMAGVLTGRAAAWAIGRFTSWRTVAVAPVTAICWSIVGQCEAGLGAFALTCWCACVIGTDCATKRLPNVLTAAGAAGMLVHATADGEWVDALIGAVGLFTCYLVVHLALPRAFGAGDVKLAFALGGLSSMAGTDAWVSAALLAPLSTGLVAIACRLSGRGGQTVPHGPSMCVATLLALASAAP